MLPEKKDCSSLFSPYGRSILQNMEMPGSRELKKRGCIAFFVLTLSSMFLGTSAQTFPPQVTPFTSQELGEHPQAFSVERLSGGRTAFGVGSNVMVHHGEGFSKLSFGWGVSITAMRRDQKGRLFIGGDSKMGVIVPDSSGELVFRSLLPLLPDSLRDTGPIWNISTVPFDEKGGGVYFNAFDQVFRFDGDSITRILPKDKFYMMHDMDGTPIIQDDDEGLYRLLGDRKKQLPAPKELTPNDDIGVTGLLPLHGSEAEWIVLTDRSGLKRYDPEKGTVGPFPSDESERRKVWGILKEERVFSGASLKPERNPYGAAYAVGTMQGGVRLLGPEGGCVAHITTTEGLPSPMVWDLEVDRRGNLWAATNDGIALIHTGTPFTRLDKGSSFDGGINDIDRSAGGTLVMATSQGVWSWKGAKDGFERIPGTQEQCMGVIPFRDGILIAGEKRLLYSDRQGPAREIADPDLDNSGPMDLTELPYSERILFGGQLGLYVHRRKSSGNWEREIEVSERAAGDLPWVGYGRTGLPADSIRLWGGKRVGGALAVRTDTSFSGTELIRYDSTDGLPKGPVVVFQDPWKEASCLFGTKEGLYRFDGEGFEEACSRGRAFCGKEKLPILEKGHGGRIWTLKGERRIVLMRPEGEKYEADSVPFNALDIGEVRAIHPDGEKVWIGGDQGAACYHPNMKLSYDREWTCRLLEVVGSEDSLLFGGSYSIPRAGGFLGRLPVNEQPADRVPMLPYGKNRMEFRFAAPFPDRQDAVTYSYKLEGFDTSWSKWEKETKKEYTNLDEGAYCFRVRARNIYGRTSSTAAYRFRILAPWYRSNWAYAGYGVAAFLFIWVVAWANGRRLAAQKRRLEKVVQERTREIRAEKEKTEKAHEQLSEAHREITDSIDYAQKIQSALLASRLSFPEKAPAHFILFKPQFRVSGDFYWMKEHEGNLYFAAVDCTGHGVPGAFMSMLGISLLNEVLANHGDIGAGELLTLLRDRVERELGGENEGEHARDGMDAALVKLPLANGKNDGSEANANAMMVEFAGANNPLYVIREGIAEELFENGFGDPSGKERLRPFKKRSDGIEVAAERKSVGYNEFDRTPFSSVSLRLQRGDMLYLFSDGYADQFGGPQGKKFRYGPFKELLVNIHGKGLEDQKAILDRTFEDWKDQSQQEQVDDVLVMGIRL